MENLLIRLLRKGDEVSIERGRLVIRPRSNKAVPPEWANENSEALIQDILLGLNQDAYRYYEYETGHYGPTRSAGLTLQFRSVMNRSYAYTIFNVELSRARNTKNGKKGAALPPKQFRINSQRCGFYKFWERSGLKLPSRMSVFHDYMGNLKEILLSANLTHIDSERLDRKTLRPLTVTAEEIKQACLPDSFQTVAGQLSNSSRTNSPDKEFPPAFEIQGLQSNSNTPTQRYGKAVIRESGVVHQWPPSQVPPEEQSVDEWLKCYDRKA